MNIQLGTIWTIVAGTAAAMVYMFNNFVSASEFRDFQVDGWFTDYYILMEKQADAEEDGQDALADEIEWQLERLVAKICAEEPEWRRCKEEEEE